MKPTYTIKTVGTDPVETLQIIGTVPSTSVVFQSSIKELQEHIAEYPARIQSLQDAQAADEALLASLTAIFTDAGVSDFTQPLDDEQTAAIQAQNDAATQTVLQEESDAISASLNTVKGIKSVV